MLISWNWIQDYVAPKASAQAVAERLMMSGLNLEEVTTVGSDVCVDLEVTSNRPDCLSQIGVAREIAVLYGEQICLSEPAPVESGPPVSGLAQVELQAAEHCPQYIARVVQNVQVGPSPKWLVDRLATLGLRSVNNIVDITNYVLMECGQPLHAFDLDRLQGRKIVVRTARAGEKITAIDQKEYELPAGCCVIADAQRPVAIAGVMGGLETEIGPATKNVLIEVADFAPMSIRATARRLGLFSDSSYRFERGIHRQKMDWASRRCAQLILQLAGGELCTGSIVAGVSETPLAEPILLRHAQIRRILGIDVADEEVLRILTALGLEPRPVEAGSSAKPSGQGTITRWQPPTWRRDLTREIDLIEEVARIHGYHHIPENELVPLAVSSTTPRDQAIERAAHVLQSAGMYEAVTVSFVSPELNSTVRPWTLAEPLSVDHSTRRKENALRQSLLPRLLESRRANERQGTFGAELFEFARVFLNSDPNDPQGQPELLGFISGRPFTELRGLIERIAEAVCGPMPVDFVPADVPGLIAHRTAEIRLNGQRWGYLGDVQPEVRQKLELKESVLACELQLAPLVAGLRRAPRFQPLPTQPAMERDLNFVLDDDVTWSDLARVVREAAGPLLERVNFESQYRGPQIPSDKKSYVLRLHYRAEDRTLTHDEVEARQRAVIEAVTQAFQAVQR